jgi:hypothetical protein
MTKKAIGIMNGNSNFARMMRETEDSLSPEMQAKVKAHTDACAVIRAAGLRPIDFITPGLGAMVDDVALLQKAQELLDADRRAIKNASYHDLKMAAQQCGCLTCKGVLENIKGTLCAAVSTIAYFDWRGRRYQLRAQRRHFIQQLRENMASPTLKHNFTQLQKEN